jgi:hypothetical protein
MVRKTRFGSSPSASTAAAMSGTHAPAVAVLTGVHFAPDREQRHAFKALQAALGMKGMIAAKGWVASMTATTHCSRGDTAARPAMPPKPPVRVGRDRADAASEVWPCERDHGANFGSLFGQELIERSRFAGAAEDEDRHGTVFA